MADQAPPDEQAAPRQMVISRIRLVDEDRAALGLTQEWLDVAPARLTNRDVMRFEKATGLTMTEMQNGLITGAAYSITALVWLGLSRAGVEVPIEDLEFDMIGMEVEQDEAPTARSGRPNARRATKRRS